jgi:hypothetical protein
LFTALVFQKEIDISIIEDQHSFHAGAKKQICVGIAKVPAV